MSGAPPGSGQEADAHEQQRDGGARTPLQHAAGAAAMGTSLEGVGIPVKLLHEAEGHTVTVEPRQLSRPWGSPEFAMLFFKVLPCHKNTNHDWSACPYSHPGERARRRCLLVHKYAAKVCPDAQVRGVCPRGEACHMTHGTFEFYMHPQKYKTKMCRSAPSCNRLYCFFSHHPMETREGTDIPAEWDVPLLTPDGGVCSDSVARVLACLPGDTAAAAQAAMLQLPGVLALHGAGHYVPQQLQHPSAMPGGILLQQPGLQQQQHHHNQQQLLMALPPAGLAGPVGGMDGTLVYQPATDVAMSSGSASSRSSASILAPMALTGATPMPYQPAHSAHTAAGGPLYVMGGQPMPGMMAEAVSSSSSHMPQGMAAVQMAGVGAMQQAAMYDANALAAAQVMGPDFPAGGVIMLPQQQQQQYMQQQYMQQQYAGMQLQQPQYVSFQLQQQPSPQLAALPLAQGGMQQQPQQQFVGGVQLAGSPMQQRQPQVALAASVPLSSAYSSSSASLNLTEQLQRLGLDGTSQ